MARDGDPEIDRALEVVVSEINSLAERQDGGPGVVLTVGGLIIGGTIIPDWQWFDDVEHVARAAFTVHTGGSIDDEHGGWARLLRGVSESLVRDREEHRAAQNAIAGLSESYRHLLAREDRTTPRVSQFSGAVAVRGARGHAGDGWFTDLGFEEDSIDRSFTVLVRVIRRCLPAPPHRARWPVSLPCSARALPPRHSIRSLGWLSA
jgi:hypothetical protein